MKETIKNLDFKTMTEDGANDLLNSLLELTDEALKESVVEIIDKIELSDLSDNGLARVKNMDPVELERVDTIPKSYEIIFNNDKIKAVAESLLEEYNDDI